MRKTRQAALAFPESEWHWKSDKIKIDHGDLVNDDSEDKIIITVFWSGWTTPGEVEKETLAVKKMKPRQRPIFLRIYNDDDDNDDYNDDDDADDDDNDD